MRKLYTQSLRLGWIALALLVGGAGGCGGKANPPPVAYGGPTLASDDLGIGKIECPATGYVVVEEPPSQGRFPGALAVAQLGVPDELEPYAEPGGAGWRIRTIKAEKATYWNALFNAIPAIREVIVLDAPSVMWPEADLAAITAGAERMKADLCLIYGPRSAEPGHAALGGIIVDTHTGKIVAYVQADAGPADSLPPADSRYEQDRRHEDPNYLVARKFDLQVRRCVIALVQRDQPRPATQPSPWRGHLSTQPVDRPLFIIPHPEFNEYQPK